MNNNLDSDDGFHNNNSQRGYALSGKIMLSAIVILFGVVIFMVCLHLYARWYLLRARRQTLNSRRRRRRSHLVFYVDANNPAANTVTIPTQGLDASLLNSLPVFVYSSKTHPESLECAVCLSEFEDNEKGRLLPKCNHSFHTECIDMWFHSHSTCPLCRSPVEPGPVTEVVVSVDGEEPVQTESGSAGSSSGLCSTCQHEEGQSVVGSPAAAGTSSSNGGRRKPLGVSIEVPSRRNESFGRLEDEFGGTESPASQMFKSPGSRLLSLKRIISRGLSPSGSFVSCGPVFAESDIERGTDETQQTQSR